MEETHNFEESNTKYHSPSTSGSLVTPPIPHFPIGSASPADSSSRITKRHTDEMAHLGKQVMLIVEDNPMIQDVLQTTLKQINVNFIACMNGQSAVEKCEEFLKEGKMFDIILMDLCMPILDGYGASQQIRLLE